MSDYDDVKKKLAIQISVLFTCICFGGVICIIIATAVVGTNTCEDICGAKYPEEDTNYNCCTNNKYNECV